MPWTDLETEAADRRVALVDAERGQLLQVMAVTGDDVLADRLRATGLWEGAFVECLGRALFGDPMLFRLHGFRLALRRTEAARVQVVVLEPSK